MINEKLKSKIVDEFSNSWNLGSTSRAVVCSDEVSAEASKKLLKLRGARLAVVYSRFSVDRSTLWNLISHALIGMLTAVSLPASVPCEDYLSILWAVKTMVKLGAEFCGADSWNLLNSLSMKSKAYFQHVHMESFQVLKLMLESESWQKVNVNLQEMGGVLNVLKKNIIVPSRCKYSSKRNYKSNSILISFLKHGNPFRATQNDEVEKEVEVEIEAEKDEVVVDLLNNHFIEEKDEDQHQHQHQHQHQDGSGGGRKYGEIDNDNDDGEAFELFMKKEIISLPRSHTTLSAAVVTQTGLNGLARYTGRYLQLLSLMPSTAPDIFACLCQLYDYYLSAVYCGFVPLDRQRALQCRYKLSAPAPDKQRDFEVRPSHHGIHKKISFIYVIIYYE